MFFLTDEDKLKKLIDRLGKCTKDIEQIKWAQFYASFLCSKQRDYEGKRLVQIYAPDQKQANRSPIFQDRKDFSWSLFRNAESYEDDLNQLWFYGGLSKHVERFKDNDTKEIKNLAQQALEGHPDVLLQITDVNGNLIKKNIRIDLNSRQSCRGKGFILADLFWGLTGMLSSVCVLLASVLFLPFHRCVGSAYFGSPTFDLHAIKWFADSLCQVASSLIFPLAMIHAKYTSDSCDVTKTEVNRLLNSIIACCDRIEAKSSQDTRLKPNSAALPIG